jgi:3-O-methylgallate 3,4-dioxygenase
MLSIAPELWPERVKADRANPQHYYHGRTYTFDELVALRKAERLAEQCTPEACRERHARCTKAINKLAEVFDGYRPDIAVVVGNDQMEVFTSEHVPALAVFFGELVEGIPRTPEFLAKLPPALLRRRPTGRRRNTLNTGRCPASDGTLSRPPLATGLMLRN